MAYTGASEEYFYANLHKSHTATVRAEVWYDGAIVIDDLPIEGGSISMKSDDLSRAALSGLQTVDIDMSRLPDTVDSNLSIYGHEIKIYRGIEYTSAPGVSSYEEVLLGVFRVQSHDATEYWYNNNPSGSYDLNLWTYQGASISIDGQDRASNIIDSRFISITQPSATVGATIAAELATLCAGIIDIDTSNFGSGLGSGVELPFSGTNTLIGPYSNVVYQEDRGKAIVDVASLINCRAFVSREGKLRLETIEVIPTSITGAERSLPPIISVSTKNTRDGVYNGVVARGERIGDLYPVQGIATNVDFSTRTYWGGPFGDVPFFFDSPLLDSVAAAELAAETRLNSLLKDRAKTFTVTTAPDPTLDPNDIVALHLPGRNAFPAKVTSLTIPLKTTDTMTVELVATEEAITNSYNI